MDREDEVVVDTNALVSQESAVLVGQRRWAAENTDAAAAGIVQYGALLVVQSRMVVGKRRAVLIK